MLGWFKKKREKLWSEITKKRFKLIWSIYKVYFVAIGIAVMLLGLVYFMVSPNNASFEATEDVVVSADDDNANGISYNFFLDFSPSMRRFFCADITSSMHTIADILEQINATNEVNRFFWCTDDVENVREASNFYDSMKSDERANSYYYNILINSADSAITDMENGTEGNTESEVAVGTDGNLDAAVGTGVNGNSELSSVISNIDLSLIFTTNIAELSDTKSDEINIIITDMIFSQKGNQVAGHDSLVERLAGRLAIAAADANISIYAITSNYSGRSDDVYSRDETVGDVETGIFYVIIYSDNIREYQNYIQQFETAMTAGRVNYNKFELLDNLLVGQDLKVDLEEYGHLELIEKENINLANGMFRGLSDNEFAIQLMAVEGTRRLTMPVSELNLAGYYASDTIGMDDTIISMETELYYPKFRLSGGSYEEFQDAGLVQYGSTGLYYSGEKWYLRLNMLLGNNLSVPSHVVMGMRNKYIVMNFKLYMDQPSYSKPGWVDSLNVPEAFENGQNIGTVMDRLISVKESTYVQLPKAERYLGNVVIYVLY